MAQAVQLLVVDWLAAVWWAGLSTSRSLSRGEDLVAAWDSSHRRKDADFSPRNFLFVHLNRLRRTKGNRPVSFDSALQRHHHADNHTSPMPAGPVNECQRSHDSERRRREYEGM